ncbi:MULTISPECIES: methionine aminopeptidase [Aneurinibacillus]|jgi:DnaJ-class molecular chaperone|nr:MULTISPECIES: methionine aminopeptidase [Aneurinibacillus]
MRLFNVLFEWKAALYEKKIAKMQAQGKCPDCNGIGANPLIMHEFAYIDRYDCPGCNGSGLFSDWAKVNGRHS